MMIKCVEMGTRGRIKAMGDGCIAKEIGLPRNCMEIDTHIFCLYLCMKDADEFKICVLCFVNLNRLRFKAGGWRYSVTYN